MASTTVNSTGFDVNTVMNTKAASTSKTTSEATQDFSSVFSSATGNSKSNQDSATSTKDVTSKTDTNNSSDNKVTDTKETVKDDIRDEIKDDTTSKVEEEPVTDEIETEADDTTIEEIATALNFILDQVKELIGVDDDTITTTMGDLGLSQGDLFNSDNLAQFVATLSGEDSTISLVADEDLYSKLQTLTDVVDSQFQTVLDNTGLTEDELSTALENLVVEENPVEIQQTVNPQETETVDENVAVQTEEPVEEDEPVVIIQDNTTKPAETYDKLPENQMDTTNLKSDSSSSSSSKTEKNQTKDFSENQSFSQNQETTVNENVPEIAEDVISYRSDNTENIMRQLADNIKLIKDDNLTQMELQLHPASLGTVNVNLVTKGGAVTAQFTTQNEQVRAAIESQVTTLQQELENQGVKVEAIEVAVESHQMERNLDEDNSRREKEGEQAEESLRATRRANINLRTLGENGDLLEEIQGADEATRIAMELMSANGNSMDMRA